MFMMLARKPVCRRAAVAVQNNPLATTRRLAPTVVVGDDVRLRVNNDVNKVIAATKMDLTTPPCMSFRLLGFMERLNSIYSPVYPLISQLMSSLERNNTNGSHILYSHVKLGSGMLPFAYQTIPTSYYVKENLAADFAEFLCMEFAGVYTAQELMNFCQFVENLKTPELWSEHLRLAGVFMAEAMNGR